MQYRWAKYEMTEDRNDQGPKWMYAIGTTYIIYSSLCHSASADLSHENFKTKSSHEVVT